MTLRVLTVVGARPQFVKAAAVSRVLRRSPEVREQLLDTGQHYDHGMAAVFFNELEIPPPDFALGIGSGSHGAQTGRMLEAIEAVLLRERPDRVVVYGDTNSTLAGALAAVKLHVPLAHVEAGLRSGNRRMPEEINRILTDQAADLLFAPTEAAVSNLEREGIGDRAHLVGDVMYDASRLFLPAAERRSRILDRLALEPGRYVLATVHRAENVDDPERLRALVQALTELAATRPVVWPLHPRTRKAAARAGLFEQPVPGLHLLEPVGYLDMLILERNAALVATDSGGVQKEAFFYRVPCLTLRAETEWVELVELGWNRLVPPEEIPDLARIAAGWPARARRREPPPELYGGGRACERIRDLLLEAR